MPHLGFAPFGIWFQMRLGKYKPILQALGIQTSQYTNLGNINFPGIDSDGRVFATPGMCNLSATMATCNGDVTNKTSV